MIEANNIVKRFDKKTVFDQFNYRFEEGRVYCILGPSGCGKSTLLRMIAGLEEPDQGKILYNSRVVTKPNSDIFMMHQAYANFPWMNCLQNVLLPVKLKARITDEDIFRAKALLAKVGLEETATGYPHELSGGMKQRLALARTLMMKPKVILMDEPLSALDPETRRNMQKLILDLHRETKNTILMVTHDPGEAERMGDTILKLKGGQHSGNFRENERCDF